MDIYAILRYVSNGEHMTAGTREKIGVTLFGAVAFSFLYLGFAQLKMHLNGPLSKTERGILPLTEMQTVFNNTKDTDGDGLTDTEEQTVYGTSIYLKDSDGDGIPDGEEVKKGTDPTCPTGKTCFKGDFGYSFAPSASTQVNLGLGGEQLVGTNEPIDPASVAGDLKAADVRALLIKGGAKKETIDKLTDEQIMKAYKDTLDSSPDLKVQKQMIEVLNSKDPSVLRAMLKQAGATDEQLKGMSDDDVRAAMQQLLNNQTKQ